MVKRSALANVCRRMKCSGGVAPTALEISEIIPENPIVAELELADARGFLFLVEESLDPVLAMLHKIEKLVEFRVL